MLSDRIEYRALLGLFGIIAFFIFLPKLIRREFQIGIVSLYLGNLVLAWLAAMAVMIPVPPILFHWDVFVEAQRTYNVYSVLILAQTIGLYAIVKLIDKDGKYLNANIAVVGLAMTF